MEWDREICLFFIKEYEKRPVLWDPKHGSYYNKEKKLEAWEEVASMLGCACDDAKKKMESLLGSFRREKARVKKSLENGKGPEDVYKSKWFAFKHMSFLLDRDETNFAMDIGEEQHSTAGHREENQIGDSRLHDLMVTISNPPPSVKKEVVRRLKEDPVPKKLQMHINGIKKRKQASNEEHRVSVADLLQKLSSDFVPREETEFDIFGRGIATQLNNMPVDEALQLQLLIQQTVTKFRLCQ